MQTYSQYINFRTQEKYDYYEAIKILEKNDCYLTDNFLSNLSSGIKSKINFIKSIADISKNKVEDIISIFKNTKAFAFFSKIKFNLNVLWKYVKIGFKTYTDIQKIIADYIAKTKIVKWTEKALRDLDQFLQNHPKVK